MNVPESIDIQQVIAQAVSTANSELQKLKNDGVKTRNKSDDNDMLPDNMTAHITIIITAVLTAVNASLPALVSASQNVNYEQKISVLKNKFQDKILDAKYNNDRLEQYGRRETIRISGVPEIENEDNDTSITRGLVIETIKKIDVDVSNDMISAAHRIGKRNSNYARQIICKFVSRQPKEQIMKNRYKAKGSDIFINEDLTPLRSKLLNYIKKNVPNVVQKSVHSIGGKIACKFSNDTDNKWHHFENARDIIKSSFAPENVDFSALGLNECILDLTEE